MVTRCRLEGSTLCRLTGSKLSRQTHPLSLPSPVQGLQASLSRMSTPSAIFPPRLKNLLKKPNF